VTTDGGRTAPGEVQRLRQKLAEYAMIVDLLTDLPESRTESEAVEALLDLAQELCAPTALGFVPTTVVGVDAAVVRPTTDAAVAEVEATASALGERQRSIELGSSFAIAVMAGEQRCGVLAVVDVVVPQDIGEYQQLLSTISGPLALVMVNAESRLALEASETNYRLLAENATDIVWRLDADSIMVWVSPSLESVLGWRPEELLGTRPRDLAHPDDQELLPLRADEILTGQEASEAELRMRASDGSYRWMSMQTRPARSDDDSADGVIVGLRDINDQVLAREALERSENLFRVAMDGAPQGMAVVGLDLRFLQVNKALGTMLGRDEEWLLAHSLRDVISPDDLEADLAGNNELFTGTAKSIVREGRWLRADGSTLWVVHSTGLLRDENNLPLFHVSHIQDNTVAHERNAELAFRASHDPLTGLMNRDQLQQRITEALHFHPRRPGRTGVLYCDIDRFKAINDGHGHAAGDEVLKTVAGRMASVLRSGDTVARIGGDEFVAVLAEVHDLSAAAGVAEKVRAAVSQPVTLHDGSVITITMSVGASLAGPEIDAHRLLRDADVALYEAKNSGRNQVRVFEHGTQAMLTRQVLADRAKAEDANAELHRALWDMSVELLAVADVRGRLTEVSAGWEQVLGFTAEELTSRPYLEFVHPDDVDRTRDAAKALTEPDHEVVNFENRYRTRDGGYRWLSWSGQTSEDSQRVFCVVRDVTDQVAARQELERSNAALEQAQRIAQIGHWTLDLATNRVTWSRELFRMQGLDPNSSPPDYAEHRRLFTEESWQRLTATLAIIRDTGVPYELELELVRPDGSHGWMLARGEVVRDANGVVVGLQGVAMDITEQKRVLDDQVATEQLLRILAENATDVVWERDVHGEMVWVSESVEAVLGWKPSELIGTRPPEIVPAEDVKLTEAGVVQLLSGKPLPMSEVRVLTAGGGFRWMSMQARPLVDAEGNVTGCVAGLRDVHDQVVARQELAESQRRYRLVAENATDAVFLVDPGGVVEWVSPSIATVLGFNAAEVIGTDATALVHPDDLAQLRTVRAAAAGGASATTFELRMRTADGDYRWMSGSTGPVADGDGNITGRITTVRDVEQQVTARDALARSEETFRQALAGARQGMALVGVDGRFLIANESLCQQVGIDWPQLSSYTEDDLNSPEQEPHRLIYDRLLSGEIPSNVHEGALRTPDGSYSRVLHSLSLVRDAQDEPLYFVSQYQDIDALFAAREAAEASERRYRMLAENATDIVWQVAVDGALEWVSASVEEILGWSPEELLGKDVVDLIHPDDRDAAEKWKSRLAAGEEVSFLESRRRTKDGDYRWMSLRGRAIADVDGRITGFIIGMRYIHDEVIARDALSHALAHDPLTGLATVPTAIERIDKLLAEIPKGGAPSWLGVLCIGVDSLRAVNEALTHAAGDLVLATLATRLADVQDNSELLARGSGDEFILILPGLSSGADAGALAEHIRLSTRGTITTGSHHFEPTVSIGIATGTIGSSGESLLRDASLAMHRAKDNGRDRSEFFLNSLAEEAQHRLQVEDGVRDGLQRGEFVPWFQPIVDLDDGEVVGYEALVRWIRPDGATVSPADFLPVAERSSLIVRLDLSVLAQAAAVLSTLPAPLHMAVNVSAATLAHVGYAGTVLRELEAAGADPARLHLEFTETALLPATETSSIRRDMAELSDAGIKWYVDDFGTGYSSIAHLRDLPIAGLKLDLSFTAGLGSSDLTCEHLAKALAGLADGLGLDTIAEGVETAQQAALLRALGWERGQGWLYGRPAPLE
jgi:diguanylate cyclase (GGDEF)-like protein/PAS domain S-box-containing protein